MLDKLLEHFYIDYDNKLQWSYIEDTPLDDLNQDLANSIKEYMIKNAIGDNYSNTKEELYL